jgi:hypothetical protein
MVGGHFAWNQPFLGWLKIATSRKGIRGSETTCREAAASQSPSRHPVHSPPTRLAILRHDFDAVLALSPAISLRRELLCRGGATAAPRLSPHGESITTYVTPPAELLCPVSSNSPELQH